MANTKSAKKNIRSSHKKRSHNNEWKKRFKSALKSLSKSLSGKDNEGVIMEKFKSLQKLLDKSSKEKVIHKNKANRVKSMYARKVSALFRSSAKTKKETKSGK